MATLDYFTVTSSGVGSIGIDFVDPDVDPDENIVFAFVEFRPRLPAGTVIWAPTLNPPRGIQLDKVKARFAPEDGVLRTIAGEPVNEKQRVTVTGNPFTLTYAGQTTTSISSGHTAAIVDAALEDLSNIGAGEVFVSGPNGGPYDVTFHGALGYSNQPLLSATNATVTVIDEGTLDAGVRLVANTSVISTGLAALGFTELVYDVVFTVPESDRTLNPFAILAPTTPGVTVDLASVTRLPPAT